MDKKSFNYPPVLDDEANYETWKRDVSIWSELKVVAVGKQALAVYLSLTGRAKNAAQQVDFDVLKAEDGTGLTALLEKLDSLFLPEQGRRQFTAFHDFYNLRRKDDTKITDFVGEFEFLYYRFKTAEMTLPDAVLAFMLLSSCNLSINNQHLVLSAMSEITYDNTRTAILRIFGKSVDTSPITDSKSAAADDAVIKTEPVFYGEIDGIRVSPSQVADDIRVSPSQVADETFYTRGGWHPRGGRYNRNRSRRGYRASGRYQSSTDSMGRKYNPTGPDGQISTCAVCRSIFHWARECPDAKERLQTDTETPQALTTVSQFTMFVGLGSIDKLQGLVDESKCSVVIDTGCVNTVCGKSWLANYVNNLSDYDKSLVKEAPSTQSFTFGSEKTFYSSKKMTLPCYINKIRGEVVTDVVDCGIPLLLGRIAIEKSGIIIDGQKRKLYFGALNQNVNLEVSSSGHYLMQIGL